MDLETAKQLLEEYPPLIEIRVPSYYAQSDTFKEELAKHLKKTFGAPEKYLALIVDMDRMPSVLHIAERIPEEQLNDFAKKWAEVSKATGNYIVTSDAQPSTIEFTQPEFIKIHSVLVDGPEIYKSKIETLNKFITPYHEKQNKHN